MIARLKHLLIPVLLIPILLVPALLLPHGAHAASAAPQHQNTDLEAIGTMNANYLRAWREYDTAWFSANLTDDYICTASDGSTLNKKEFVNYPNQATQVQDSHIEDLAIRVNGSTAVVTANNIVNWKSGKVTATRYTDTYVRIDGKWKAIAAHLSTDKNYKPTVISAN